MNSPGHSHRSRALGGAALGRASRPAACRAGSTPTPASSARNSSASSTAATGATSAWNAKCPSRATSSARSVGERSVIMVRDLQRRRCDVVENRCAHRGVAFCRERHGTVKDFVCPYHQWNYKLNGNLIGLPFRRGVRQDGKVTAACRADFALGDHGLTTLQVARRGGAVFASFDHDVSPSRTSSAPRCCTTSTACSRPPAAEGAGLSTASASRPTGS